MQPIRAVLVTLALLGIGAARSAILGGNSSVDYFEDVASINCIEEISGSIEGEAVELPSQYVFCDNAQFCQKVSAHYVSVAEVTKITLRGCDQMKIEGKENLYHAIRCKKSGCQEVKSEFDHEIYHVCCCNTDFCNNAHMRRLSILSLLCLATVYIL